MPFQVPHRRRQSRDRAQTPSRPQSRCRQSHLRRSCHGRCRSTDGTPASYTWNVDLAAPNTTIGSNPDDPSNGRASASAPAKRIGRSEPGRRAPAPQQPPRRPAAQAATPSTSAPPTPRATPTGLPPPTLPCHSAEHHHRRCDLHVQRLGGRLEHVSPTAAAGTPARAPTRSRRPSAQAPTPLTCAPPTRPATPTPHRPATPGRSMAAPNTTIDSEPETPSSKHRASPSAPASPARPSSAASTAAAGRCARLRRPSPPHSASSQHLRRARHRPGRQHPRRHPRRATWTIDLTAPTPVPSRLPAGFSCSSSGPESTFECRLGGGGGAAAPAPSRIAGCGRSPRSTSGANPVAGRCADVERVTACSECRRHCVGAGAAAPAAAVEAALERRAGLARAEGEARRGVVRRIGRAGAEGRVRAVRSIVQV